MNILKDDDFYTFWEDDGIVCFRYKKNIITLDIAQHGVSIRSALSNYQRCKLFADLVNVKSITKETRDFYATHDAGKLVIACAVYTPSVLTKVLFSFFIGFNKPAIPMRSFTSKEKAFNWLNEFEEKSLNANLV
jgi:hypothetical protein